MSPGAVVAVGAWGSFTLWILACLVRDLVRYHGAVRGERRAERHIAALDELEAEQARAAAGPDAWHDGEWADPPLIARTDEQLERLINVPWPHDRSYV